MVDGIVPPGVGALLLTSAALMGSPGPSTISVTAVGAAFGLRRSLPYALGLILGTSVVLLVVASGIFAALLAVPGLAPVLTWGSVGYIVWLAWQIARAPPLKGAEAAAAVPPLWGGLLLAAANPKAYVAIAAVFAGGRLAGLSPVAEAVGKVAALGTMIVVIHLAWLVAGAALARLLRDPVASRVVNVGLAVLLVVASLWAVIG